MRPTITRNEAGRTSFGKLFSFTFGEIEKFYRSGIVNQSEYEMFCHFWDKSHDKNCNCVFDMIERGEKDIVWNWLLEINRNDRFDFFCAFGWPEGYHYCMSNKNYYDLTGFSVLQRNLVEFIPEQLKNGFYS